MFLSIFNAAPSLARRLIVTVTVHTLPAAGTQQQKRLVGTCRWCLSVCLPVSDCLEDIDGILSCRICIGTCVVKFSFSLPPVTIKPKALKKVKSSCLLWGRILRSLSGSRVKGKREAMEKAAKQREKEAREFE